MNLRIRQTLELGRWRRHLVFWVGAVATGAIAVAFAYCSDAAMRYFHNLSHRFLWWPYLVAPLGLAFSAWLTKTIFVGTEGSGIPQVIATLAIRKESDRNRLLSIKIAAGKLLLTTLALASGASIGREGPTVQVGASIMHSLRRFARFHAADIDRGLILAGGAAGIAAAFNTPLAGVVFAIEELSRSFEQRTSGTILMAVIVAGVTSLALVGNYTYFGSTAAVMGTSQTWLAIPICGIAGGLAGGLFSTAMIRLSKPLPPQLQSIRVQRPVLFAGLCGLIIAILGWLSSGSTYGTGYSEAKELLQQGAAPTTGFAFLKATATLISYVSGVPGGVFAPSLAVGAGLGSQLYSWLPLAPSGVMVILCMAAYFSGVAQAPLTALVIVTEMTDNRALVLPLMAVVLLGRGASALVCRVPLYQSLAQNFLDFRKRTAD
jgi:H+/Cl- antiporter ClcA